MRLKVIIMNWVSIYVFISNVFKVALGLHVGSGKGRNRYKLLPQVLTWVTNDHPSTLRNDYSRITAETLQQLPN